MASAASRFRPLSHERVWVNVILLRHKKADTSALQCALCSEYGLVLSDIDMCVLPWIPVIHLEVFVKVVVVAFLSFEDVFHY